MKTFVLSTKPGLLHWLEPVRMLWYAAERDGQVEIVDAEGLDEVDLRARLWTALAGQPYLKWRVVLVVDEQDARLSDPRLEMAVALGADRSACHVLVFERAVDDRLLIGGGENEAPVIPAKYWDGEEPNAPTVVRALDFMAENRLESRLDAAYTVLALATLDAVGEGRGLEAFRGEFHLNNANVGPRLGPTSSNRLPGGLYFTDDRARLATILDAYVRRLRRAKKALKAPDVDVALFGERARAAVKTIVAGRIHEIPLGLAEFWSEFGDVPLDSNRDAQGQGASAPRLPPPLPGGFWHREDRGRWPSWRDRFDGGVVKLWDRMHRQARDAHEAGLASLRAGASNERADATDPRSGAPEHHPPELMRLELEQVRSKLARLEKSLKERSTVTEAAGVELPDVDWRKEGADLAVALAHRPTRRQVLVPAVAGVLGLMPAALLQVSVLSRVVSLAAIVGLVVGVVFWVRGTSGCWPHGSSVLCRIARALQAIRVTALGRLQPLRDRRARLVGVLETQLGTWIDEQDVHSLREAVVRLELDHARYLYHQRMLDLHVGRAVGLLEAIGGVGAPRGDRASADVEHVAVPNLSVPEHLEPTYAFDGDAVDSTERKPQFAVGGGRYDLEPRYFPGLERIVFSRCRSGTSPAETDGVGKR